MMIRLTGSAPPTEQIRDQIRGLVAAGQLGADERLPSVRQLAHDLGVAPGTVAKAYKALEIEGVVKTRTAGGTRVNPDAALAPREVVQAARELADSCAALGVGQEDAVRILRAVWLSRGPAA